MGVKFDAQFRVWALTGLNDAYAKFQEVSSIYGYNYDSAIQKGKNFTFTIIVKRKDELKKNIESRAAASSIREKAMPEDSAVGDSASALEITYNLNLEDIAEKANDSLTREVINEALRASEVHMATKGSGYTRFPGTSSIVGRGLALLIERAVYEITIKELKHLESLYTAKKRKNREQETDVGVPELIPRSPDFD